MVAPFACPNPLFSHIDPMRMEHLSPPNPLGAMTTHLDIAPGVTIISLANPSISE